jgi:hypothetical protein
MTIENKGCGQCKNSINSPDERYRRLGSHWLFPYRPFSIPTATIPACR